MSTLISMIGFPITNRFKVEMSNILAAEEGVIVHGCNAQGVMGSGLAKQIKHEYPAAFDAYKRTQPKMPTYAHTLGRPKLGTIKLGSITQVEVARNKWIVNAVTQFNYGNQPVRYVSYDAVAESFEKVSRLILEIQQSRGFIPTLRIPPLGAGRGNGNLRVVLEIIAGIVPEVVPMVLHVYRDAEPDSNYQFN